MSTAWSVLAPAGGKYAKKAFALHERSQQSSNAAVNAIIPTMCCVLCGARLFSIRTTFRQQQQHRQHQHQQYTAEKQPSQCELAIDKGKNSRYNFSARFKTIAVSEAVKLPQPDSFRICFTAKRYVFN